MSKIGCDTMDVGVVATHLPPAKGYGGVSVTAGILTQAWSARGRKIGLLASDESIGGRLQPSDVRLGDTVTVDLYRCYGFRRWGFGLGAIPKLWRLCAKAPLVYIHGIATWPCTLAAIFCVLLRRRFLVAVHGGLMPEHVALIRREKPHKWLYYRLLTLPTLRRALAIHCTSDTETAGVRAVLGDDAPILQVPNGIDSREATVAARPQGEGLHIAFLGHIQQEKGINAFIRAWLKTRGPADRLSVAGRSVDGAYFDEFSRLVEQAGGAIRYHGYLSRAEVLALLADSHFLTLPSGLEETGGMRENFGNVVAEAMACGRPVLVAKGLAWDHLQSLGAGFVFERNEDSLQAVLRRARALQAADWQAMSGRARQHVEGQLDALKLADQVWRAMAGSDAAPWTVAEVASGE